MKKKMSKASSKKLGELHSKASFLVFGYCVFKRFCETSCHDNNKIMVEIAEALAQSHQISWHWTVSIISESFSYKE